MTDKGVTREEKIEEGEKIAKISTVTMVFLSLIKGVIALISNSLALLADAINSFSDIFTSFAV